MEVSVARYLRTPLRPAGPRLSFPTFGTAYAATAIGALLSFATSLSGSITATPHRAKANIFRRPSILFRPHTNRQMNDIFGGVAGYRPRVRSAYYMRVYYHSSRRNTLYIGRIDMIEKGERRYLIAILVVNLNILKQRSQIS